MNTLSYEQWFESRRHELRTRYFAEHDDPRGEHHAGWCRAEYEREFTTQVGESVCATTGKQT